MRRRGLHTPKVLHDDAPKPIFGRRRVNVASHGEDGIGTLRAHQTTQTGPRIPLDKVVFPLRDRVSTILCFPVRLAGQTAPCWKKLKAVAYRGKLNMPRATSRTGSTSAICSNGWDTETSHPRWCISKASVTATYRLVSTRAASQRSR
jgi:hypothetical protein